MKKSGMGGKFLLFILTAATMLSMQGFQVLAETLQTENQSEISEEQDQPDMEELEDREEPGTSELDDDQEVEADTDPDEEKENKSSREAINLEGHTVDGLNPEQVVVNLFDYWQDWKGSGRNPEEEIVWDWPDADSFSNGGYEYESVGNMIKLLLEKIPNRVELAILGISNEHLLRFGLTRTVPLEEVALWGYGEWNRYSSQPYTGIVKNTLGADGFPKLNLAGKTNLDFEHYAIYHPDWLTQEKKEESLDYLFKPGNDTYKASYSNVQGLFQMEGGYYYYNSTKNFAEFDASQNKFILYDSPGVGTSVDENSGAGGNYGEFFPFNKGSEVFNAVDSNGKLIYTDADKERVVEQNGTTYLACTAAELNHYIGMTVEVPFLQPAGGVLPGNESMCFEFSGDDDVWIFIDDVLVADLGGIHDACSVKIDFSTGVVSFPNGKGTQHSLRDSFQAAYPNTAIAGFNGNTFADNTVHTLKMFYLERGHMASNLYLKFNLQIARYDQLKKVDQNGNAIPGVTFELYPAKEYESNAEGRFLCNSTVSGKTYYVEQTGNTPLIKFTTGNDGMADFIDQATNSGYSFSRSPTNFYILRETSQPPGYRSLPVDIVLEYNPGTTMLSVANRWESGAYASFTSYVNERTGAGYQLTYGEYQAGSIVEGTIGVSGNSKKNGLVLAVPMMQIGGSWQPLYGSNIEGFHTVGDVGNTADSMQKALLEAALNQCLYEKGWYLEWNEEKGLLEGNLSDLPGRADRYQHVNPGGDMRMVYIIIEPDGFTAASINVNSSEARYQALKTYVKTSGVENAVNMIYGSPGANAAPGNRNVNMLNTTQFMRIFRSLIYIPNEQRELRVQKVDKNGTPVNGAVFAIFNSIEEAEKENGIPSAKGTTATVDDVDGILIFKPQVPSGDGYAKMEWAANAAGQKYYLKEISAPTGYGINETIIPIVVGTYSIYADAGDKDDGVSVMAGVGQLFQTMKKYASDGDVDITLRDITAIAQEQASGSFELDGWIDAGMQKDLQYGSNTEMGMDYGLPDGASESTSFFTTDTGFLRTRVIQNAKALNNNNANQTNLYLTDLTGLFSLLNVVVVEDSTPPGRELRVLKVDEDGKPLNGATFKLYSSEDTQEENVVASGTTANVNGQDGVLVFQDQTDTRPGMARINWTVGNYYLKEISAPNGYQINETLISVVVETNAVYADAGTEDDGVAVMAGVGSLDWNAAAKYMDASGKAKPTLRDITATAKAQPSGEFDTNGWTELADESGQTQKKDLHYGINKEMGMDYGIHNGTTETTPFFVTETGFLSTSIVQNVKALEERQYDDDDTLAAGSWDNLQDADLTDWFIQLNVIVVRDRKIENPGDTFGIPTTEIGDPGADPGTEANRIISMESFLTSFDTLLNRIGIPETGDDSLMWWWALLSVVSLLGISATTCNLVYAKQKQKADPVKKEQKEHSLKQRLKEHPLKQKLKEHSLKQKLKAAPPKQKPKAPPLKQRLKEHPLKQKLKEHPPKQKLKKQQPKPRLKKQPSKQKQKKHLKKRKQKKHPSKK